MHAYVTVWVIMPLALIFIGMMIASVLAYQNSVTRLVLERHHQLANLAAISISQAADDYVHSLELLRTDTHLFSPSAQDRAAALAQQSEIPGIFNAGIFIVDEQGIVLHASRSDLPELSKNISTLQVFHAIRENRKPAFSGVTPLPGGGDVILIGVPHFDAAGDLRGAIIGALDLASAPLNEPILRITIGKDGFAYLVDGTGVIIAHPDPQQIGKDYSERPFVAGGVSGAERRSTWVSPTGERFVGADAAIENAGWVLVVKEPWLSVTEITRFNTLVIIGAGLIAMLFVSLLAWKSLRRVTVPIQEMVSQIDRIAAGDPLVPIQKSEILEVDRLRSAFDRMGAQIAAYRTGLRRYVGAITQSQEEERLRIARELHDETIQSLLAIARRMELHLAGEQDHARAEQLEKINQLVNQSIQGIRQISKDLRPMALEDLGLVPAIQMLVRTAHEGDGAIPHARFEVVGEATSLHPEQELAIYRITQEALSNVRRHASATGVLVELAFTDKEVVLRIQDDGIGFSVPNSLTELVQTGSLGLMGIQERVWAAGGHLDIRSSPGSGSCVLVAIPVEKPS
jgi:signal transduction histidine kinase